MNILMMTNTYMPLVGGLERSVREFSQAYRRRGHRVLVAAPMFEGAPKREEGVLRVPAIEHVRGTEFSLKLPVPPSLMRALVTFHPDIIHAHHPFLMGNTALRLAHTHRVPLVFTHHTLFEQYTHYLPADSPVIERFILELATGFANLCDLVFAPSHSVEILLRERGVTTPVEVVPTGVAVARFARGSGQSARTKLTLPKDAFVVGHVGRLSPEKNLGFLAHAVARFLSRQASAYWLVVGGGPLEDEIQQICRDAGVADRLRMAGTLTSQALIDAYHAMDVFAFASKSETQGLVVAEAMAAGLPVVAIDAPGVRDVVEDGRNGRLLPDENAEAFAQALESLMRLPTGKRRQLKAGARATAESLSMERCADRALTLYEQLREREFVERSHDDSPWATALRRVHAEWELLKTVTKATATAIMESSPPTAGVSAAGALEPR